jgi:predicted Co/Zn/Cd cation transporter (cation efflux family)
MRPSLLHTPDRAENHEEADHHLYMAARLSRAMWIIFHTENYEYDERDIEALKALADEIADHASAAEYLCDQ